jgi:two-component system phosphate regulon sensor histidine kinase PhoR
MHKKKIYFIFTTIGLALIGLITVQAFLVSKTLSYEKQEMDEKVNKSLELAAIRHEKIQNFIKYKAVFSARKEEEKEKLIQDGVKNMLDNNDRVTMKDTTVFRNGKKEKYFIIAGKSVDTLTGLVTEHRLVARNYNGMLQLSSNPEFDFTSADSGVVEIPIDDRLENLMLKKANYVNDFLIEMFRDNIEMTNDERLNITLLDSILRKELEAVGIDSDYEFNVTYEDDESINILFKDLEHFNPKLTEYDYKTALFPGDIFRTRLYLTLKVHHRNSLLLGGSWRIISISILLLIFMIFTFYVVMSTILKQRKISELKNDFINNMTHELKTPISTISLACEAISDPDIPKDPESIESYLDMINQENKRLGTLVENVLQTAIIDKGELKLQTQPINLNVLLEKIVSNTKFLIESKGGEIDFIEEDKEAYTEGDKIHITNIFHNLLDNSIKYSKGVPKVKIGLKKEKDFAVITIQDEGIGIPKEHLKKIFEKLYRVPTGNVHNVKGFGLGLSYVKAIVDQHDGQISVSSEMDVGTIFNIKLKLSKQ